MLTLDQPSSLPEWLAAKAELDRRRAEENKQAIDEDLAACGRLSEFIKRAWHVLEPGTMYTHSWHIDAISDHLTACANGQLQRLVINIPPGCMKSLAVGVFFPMWVWGPFGKPHSRFVGMAHEESLGIRDNTRCRRIVESEWFQSRWQVPLRDDQNEKKNFENVFTGFRQVATKNITGKRGDYVLIDDPISVDDARSVVEREAINEWFRESLPTRMNDQEKSVIILIMQRVHEDDPTGMILAKNLGYEHLMLPMRFEPERRCVTSIGFQDPRTKPGELLFPARFSEFAVQRLEREMTPYSVAGQLQQRPVPREGAMFKRAWFKPLKAIPAGTRFVRYWDLAATEEQFGADPAYTVGLKLGLMPDGRYVIADVNRLRAEGTGVRRMIRETAQQDGRYCEIGIPQDPGQAGKVMAQDMVAMMAGYVIRSERETGDKITRAEPVAAQAEAGNLYYLEGQEWWPQLEAELITFPGSKFKDQVDALSGAFSRLMNTNLFGVSEGEIAMEPVNLAALWGRCAAIDITKTQVSIVWAIFNRTTDAMQIYEAYQAPRQAMPLHASIITTSKAPWVPVLFNMEADGRSKEEGVQIATSLAKLSVEVQTVEADEEAGVDEIGTRLASKRLRVFNDLSDWFGEYRRFVRDEKGDLPADAGIMRATALLALFGSQVAVTEHRAMMEKEVYDAGQNERRQSVTGY